MEATRIVREQRRRLTAQSFAHVVAVGLLEPLDRPWRPPSSATCRRNEASFHSEDRHAALVGESRSSPVDDRIGWRPRAAEGSATGQRRRGESRASWHLLHFRRARRLRASGEGEEAPGDGAELNPRAGRSAGAPRDRLAGARRQMSWRGFQLAFEVRVVNRARRSSPGAPNTASMNSMAISSSPTPAR